MIYTYEWVITNMGDTERELSGIRIQLDNVESGYWWQGTFTVNGGAATPLTPNLNSVTAVIGTVLAPGQSVTVKAKVSNPDGNRFRTVEEAGSTGGWGVTGSALSGFSAYTPESPPPPETVSDTLPTVTFWAFPPRFGQKNLIPPPRPAALDYPTTAGPNAEGSIDGLLATPAMVPDAGTGNISVANVEFTLSPGDISTKATIGILPFKEGG